MSREPDSEGGPGVGDGPPADEFDAIIAGWRREGQVPEWPTEPVHGGPVHDGPVRQGPAHGGSAPVEPAAPRAEEPLTPVRPYPAVPAEDHFVPPEPPPLPRLGPPALVGLTLLGLGLVLVIAPGWVGVPLAYGVPLGLIGLASGLGWLVLRLWPDAPSDGDDGPDDGAVI